MIGDTLVAKDGTLEADCWLRLLIVLSLPTGRLPQGLIQTCWFNSDPVAFAGVFATTNHLACPHVAVEIGGFQVPNTFFGTIELLSHLGGRKSSRGPVALHPLPVDQRGNGHQIVFSVYGSSIDVHYLQRMRLILGIHGYPFSLYWFMNQRKRRQEKPATNPVHEHDDTLPVEVILPATLSLQEWAFPGNLRGLIGAMPGLQPVST